MNPNPVDTGVYGEILARHFQTIGDIVYIVSIMLGVSLLLGAFFQFKRYGEMRTFMSQQMTMAGPLLMLICASILLVLPVFINVELLAIFGSDSPLRYEGSTDGLGQLIPPILIFVRVIGVIAVVRGVMMLSRAGHQAQPGTIGKALTQIIAGALCIHILGVTHLMENIFDIS